MLAGADLDGALIAVPTDRHVEVLAQVMAAGVPALCEKPCGLTVAEATRCAGIAAEAGLMLQVGVLAPVRARPDRLRQRMLDGDLGDILAVNCYQWDAAPPGAEFRGSSGGIYVDMGVHEFDQVRWLTGQEFSSVKTAASPGAGTDPDCAQLVAELDGGSTAVVSLGRWHPAGDSCKVEVFGTKGTRRLVVPRPGERRRGLPRGAAAAGRGLRQVGRPPVAPAGTPRGGRRWLAQRC